jgi:broad specificity phosphatase PhoE
VYLLLTRHGESEFNRDGLSPVDSPLTELGREQAQRLGAWLAEHETIDAFYASTLTRARQTAEIVNQFLQMDVTYWDDLREADEYPLPHVPRHSEPLDPFAASPPDEVHRAFRARIECAVARIVEAHPEGTVLVVAHGGSLGVLLRLLTGAPAALFSTDNCTLHKLSWRSPDVDARLGGHWILHYLNRRSHLGDTG